MKYYISDLHLFHENAIKFDHRPFESVQEMHEVILKNWNDRVTNGDFVYLLGDMSLRGKNEDLIAFVARLKGRKVLIKGSAFPYDFKERIISEQECDTCSIYHQDFVEELRNIKAHANLSEYSGNMVHYVISSHSVEAASEMTELLVQNLRKANRINSRRMERNMYWLMALYRDIKD